MAKVLVYEESLSNIGDAIRRKTGKNDTFFPSQMGAAIDEIELGASLPVLTNPATAENIQKGFEAVDGNGNKITGTHTEADTPTLPALTSPATSTDIAEGKESIDANGNKITGSVDVPSGKNLGADARSYSNGIITLSRKNPADFLLRAGKDMAVTDSAANFGDATTPDVLAGKTFTSKAGLKVAGTHVCKTVAEMTADATATTADIMTGKTAYVNGVKIEGAAVIAESVEYEEVTVSNSATAAYFSLDRVTHVRGCSSGTLQASTIQGVEDKYAHYVTSSGSTYRIATAALTFSDGSIKHSSYKFRGMNLLFVNDPAAASLF